MQAPEEPGISLFQYFKVNPLRCCAVLLFGELILDNDLSHVFAGWKLCAKLKTSIGDDALKISLTGNLELLGNPHMDRLAAAVQSQLSSQLRQTCRLIEPCVVHLISKIQRRALMKTPQRRAPADQVVVFGRHCLIRNGPGTQC